MKNFLLLIVIFNFTTLFSQKKEGKQLIDSLETTIPKILDTKSKVDALNMLAVTYRLIDNKSCEENAQKALDLAQKIKYTDGIAYAYRNIGIAKTSQDNYDAAILNYENALKTTNNKKIRGQVIGSLCRVYSLKSDFAKALEYANQSLSLFEEVNDKQLQSSALQNISTLYIYLGNAEKSKLYREKSIEILKSKVDTIIKSKLEVEKCLTTAKDTQKANNYYLEKLKIASSKGQIIETFRFLINESRFLVDSGKYDNALQILKPLLLSEEKKTNNNKNISSIYYLLGDVYLGKYKNAKSSFDKKEFLNISINSLKKRIELISDLNLIDENYRTYRKLYIVYKLQGNYISSLDAYEKSITYKDSIFNNDTKETIKNLEDKREIELRDKQIQLDRITLKNKEKQKWYFIAGLLLLSIIGTLLYYQSRNRRKTNYKLQLLNSELDQANKTKTRFFSILNHDLRGPVANLVNFLQLQKESPELLDEESSKRMQDKTMVGAENLLNSMEDILQWSKSQMENFKPQPKEISINSLFEDIKNHFLSEENVKIIFENPENSTVTTDENYLKTIIRNLTGNAIKALDCFVPRNDNENPNVIWKAWQENNNFFLSITDNGKGAAKEQFKALYDENEVVGIKSGLGLHLIRDLAKAINCEILVESKENSGTTFTLKLNN